MFAKCEMQMVNFMGTELHETKFSLPEAVNLLADLKIKLS